MRRLILLACILGGCSAADPFYPIPARFNRAWETATSPYPGRYAGLDPGDTHLVRHKELRFARLLDDLTALDGCGDDHGCCHRKKHDREQELWELLEKLPSYPGEAKLLLAAIDDVYLAYHWNGYWGYDWHWPYFNCFKAGELAHRLASRHPEAREEALWTLIYCYRVSGMTERDSTDTPAGKEQEKWTGSLEQARMLCRELLKDYPQGRHAEHARQLLGKTDVELSIYRQRSPTFGPRPLPLEAGSRWVLGLFSREGP